jgi:hypothetical protein
MQLSVKLNGEQVCEVVYDELTQALHDLEEDLSNSDRFPIFHTNPVLDTLEMIKMIEALRTVISWYSIPE